MKIAFIGQKGIPTKYQGVERHVEELSVRLTNKGHSVFAYARNNYTNKSIQEYRGVNIIRLASIPAKYLDVMSHTFLSTIHAIFQDYDVIHYHSIIPAFFSFIIKIFKRKTVLVATCHSRDYTRQKRSTLARICLKIGEYVTLNIPDITIAVSKNLAKNIGKKSKKRVEIISDGIDVSHIPDSAYLKKWNLTKNSYLIFVGKFSRNKGVHYLIDAFKMLEDKHLTREKKLVIVGDGIYKDDYVLELKDMARGRENIIFTGSQSGEALAQLFSHAYLFVNPSESEGPTLALLEAMGYGKAILASDIEENRETVGGGTAEYFHSEDAYDLEKKLVYFINNPLEIKKIGEKNLMKAQRKYSWDNIVNEIESIYREKYLEKQHIIFKIKTNERNY